jgi:hypothetical protein
MPDKKITLSDVYELLKEFREEMKCQYVTKDRFKPVESLTYGLVTLMLMTIVAAILAQVIKAL